MPDQREYRITSPSDLMAFLLGPPLRLSRNHAKELLKFQTVGVRGMTRVRHDTPLAPGDLVTIGGRPPSDTALERSGLRIVHIDDAIIVIDKPAGLLSMGSEREKEKTAHRMLNELLKATNNSPRQQAFIVHRLDRETSGLMLFARSAAIQESLQRNWKSVTKRYLAIVEGTPGNASATLRDRLVESKSLKVHRVAKGGAAAITHYRVMRAAGARSLLEVTIETGRKHQIRVQLASIGHPVVGDDRYGAKTDPARRLALHACELRFPHPVSGAPMEFHSALPARLSALIERRRE